MSANYNGYEYNEYMLTPEEAAAEAAAAAAVANAPYICVFSAAGFSLLLQDLPAGGEEIDRILVLVERDAEVGDSFPGVTVRNDMNRVYVTDLDRSWELVMDDSRIDLAALSNEVSVALLKGELNRMDLDARNIKAFMAFLLSMAS